jgi:hypothetical protein
VDDLAVEAERTLIQFADKHSITVEKARDLFRLDKPQIWAVLLFEVEFGDGQLRTVVIEEGICHADARRTAGEYRATGRAARVVKVQDIPDDAWRARS